MADAMDVAGLAHRRKRTAVSVVGNDWGIRIMDTY